jgi:histidyl-tRNA synthetase
VWEVWPPKLGAQSTLGGGGRYDGLAEQLGGRPTPGVGWASGIERVIMELKDQHIEPSALDQLDVYITYQAEGGKLRAFELAESLRAQGIRCDLAFGDRRLGKQLSAADRSGARYALILGETELASDTVTLKELRTGEQRTIPRRELVGAFSDS